MRPMEPATSIWNQVRDGGLVGTGARCRSGPSVRFNPPASSLYTDIGAFGEPGLTLGNANDDDEEDPTPPSPGKPVVDVEGVIDWHADTSPFAQFCAFVSCCCMLLPGIPSGVGA